MARCRPRKSFFTSSIAWSVQASSIGISTALANPSTKKARTESPNAAVSFVAAGRPSAAVPVAVSSRNRPLIKLSSGVTGFAGINRVTRATSGVSRIKKITVFTRLKIVCAFASCLGDATSLGLINSTRSTSNGRKINHTSAPSTFTSTCTIAVRNAGRPLPRAASSAVTHVPMLAPNTIAIPVGRSTRPEAAIAMTIPVVALED